MAWFNGIWKRMSLYQVLQGLKGDKGEKGDPGGPIDISKTLTYGDGGELFRITTADGTKTFLYNNGRLERINATGAYKTKVINYANGRINDIEVS